MSKDISNIVKKYVETSLNREDISVGVTKQNDFYYIHIVVYINPDDTDNDIIRKGIDKFKLYNEIGMYFDLHHRNCQLTYVTTPGYSNLEIENG